MKIEKVTVIGVTGTMGANVAGIFAAFGDATVYCVGRDITKVQKTIPRIINSVRADAIFTKLIPQDYSTLEECVAQSDLVFESVSEDMLVKVEIAKQVAKSMDEKTIVCTGTSGLSISEIASYYPESLRGNIFGVHLFNPPYSMPLCELIPTVYSNKDTQEGLKDYLKTILFRTVVEVKDSPAFLGNRIGFQFINEAMQFAEKYKENGGIDYIDEILGTFTGRSMAPVMTADFVGLDIHKAIVDNLWEHTDDYSHHTYLLPEFALELTKSGNLGRKSGKGLYQLVTDDNGNKIQLVYDIKKKKYRNRKHYDFVFAEKMKSSIAEGDYVSAFIELINNRSLEAELCLSFLLKYIVYSVYVANEIGYTIAAADDVMATGFNWCPPIALYQAFSTVGDVRALMRERIPEIYESACIDSSLVIVERSIYDYRPYFKSGR